MYNRISLNYRLYILITLIVLSIFFLTSCSKPTAIPTPIDLIQPGETINGVLVTTGSADSTFVFDLPWTKKNGDEAALRPFFPRTIEITLSFIEASINLARLDRIFDKMVRIMTSPLNLNDRPVSSEYLGF